jgi:FdhE protein
MHRTPSRIWDTDIRPRLDTVAQQHPEWHAWLALLEQTLRELDEPAWAAVVPQPCHDRPAGAPLLAEAMLTIDPTLARRWVRRLLKQAAMVAGPNASSRAMIDSHRFDALGLLEAAVCQDEDRLADLSQPVGADFRALGALAQLATLPLLQACGRHLARQVPPAWHQGYCPMCGAWPTLAEVRGLERTHRWRCGRCGGDWGLALLCCPFCGEADHQRLGSLIVEDSGETCIVNTCLTCKGYIKTLTTLQATPAYVVVLADLATVEWDVVALQRGYTRPTRPKYPLGVRLVAPPSRIRTFFSRRP